MSALCDRNLTIIVRNVHFSAGMINKKIHPIAGIVIVRGSHGRNVTLRTRRAIRSERGKSGEFNLSIFNGSACDLHIVKDDRLMSKLLVSFVSFASDEDDVPRFR